MQLSSEINTIEKQIEKLNEKINFLKFKQSKIVVGIISCLKYNNKMDAIRETWVLELKKAKIPYFFIVGDPTIKSVEQKEDVLVIPVEDNYESLPKKVALFYEYIHDHTDYDFVYKIDDDCFLNVANFHKSDFWLYDYSGKIIGLDPSGILPDWHFGKCEDPKLNSTLYWGKYQGSWCGGGYGYFLSRKSLKIIKNNKKYLFDELYEDKAVGDVLRKNNILPSENKNYSPLNPFEFNINVNNDKQFVALIEKNLVEKLFDYTLVMEIRGVKVMKFIHSVVLDPSILTKKKILNNEKELEARVKKLTVELEEAKNNEIQNKTQNKFLEEELGKLKLKIQWYKDNYENKKLPAIIKDKLFKKNKK